MCQRKMENFWRELAILLLWFVGIVLGYLLLEAVVFHIFRL